MADAKITALTELTDVALADLVAIIDDPSGTPLSKKATVQNVLESVNNASDISTIAEGDRIPIIDDPAGTPTIKYTTPAELRAIVGIESFIIACSDETTVLGAASTSVPLATFRMPYAFTVTAVRASLRTAGTGAALITCDIHESGTTILSTKITIDATEKTSTTAATAPVISDSSLADDALIELFLDQRDTDNVATGLKITITGYKT